MVGGDAGLERTDELGVVQDPEVGIGEVTDTRLHELADLETFVATRQPQTGAVENELRRDQSRSPRDNIPLNLRSAGVQRERD